jgi:hypothetical protein
MDNTGDMSTSRPLYLLVAASLTGVVSAGGIQDKKVTFSQVAAPASRLLPALGEAAGVPLRATMTTGKDVLLISVKDVPLGVLMQKIADTENAVWEKENDGFRLNRDGAHERDDENRERQTLAARYQKDLQKVHDEVAKMPALDSGAASSIVRRMKEASGKMEDGSGWQLFNSLNNEAPGGRLLARLIDGFKATDLATIGENTRVVFASNPNRMQHPLPASADRALGQFLTEQNAIATAGSGENYSESPYMQLRTFTLTLKEQPAKVIVIITRRPFEGSLAFSMQVLDARDRVITTSDRIISGTMEQAMAGLTAEPSGKETPIKLSKTSAALRGAFQNMGGGGPISGTPVADDIKKQVADATKFDPLSYVPSEALIGYAEQKNVNLVAVLSDTTIMANFPFAKGDLVPSQIPMLLSVAGEEPTVADGWMTIAPSTPVTARQTRTDRAALSRMLQTMISEGTLSLDNAAAYAIARPGVTLDLVAMLCTAAIQPASVSLFEQNTMSALRFYGSLTPAQRPLVAAKKPISLASLSQGEEAALSDMVFGVDSRINDDQPMEMDSAEPNVYPSSESTELLPNGWSRQGTVLFVINDALIVLPMHAGGISMGDAGMDPGSLAWRVASQENPQLGGNWANRPENQIDLTKLQTANRRTVEMNFELSDHVKTHFQLRQVMGVSKAMTFADLPADFRKQYDQSLEQYKNMKINGPGPTGVTPPSS